MYEYNWWEAWQETLIPMLFLVLGFFFHAYLTKSNAVAAARRGKVILADAVKEAESIRNEAKVLAREKAMEAKEKVEEKAHNQRKELIDLENRIIKRESDFDRKISLLDRKEKELEEKIIEAGANKNRLIEKEGELAELIAQENKKLQQLAEISRDQAREELVARMRKELEGDKARLIRHAQNEARLLAEKEARNIVSQAIERYAGEQVSEVTTTWVRLPNDEMKGRIIGKEGRNIRSFEQITGVNLLIDETPELVVLSCFNPMRRETARITLERLIEDGRIHPANIEEIHKKVEEEIEDTIRKAGEDALYELGIHGVDPELISILGRLKFRHSYSQNVLQHSIETAQFMGIMAAELGLDTSIAKRAGIFHDIGKAADHDIEGGHAEIGANLLRKYGEDPIIVNACAAHHNDVEQISIYSTLAAAADAITAARPGARVQTTDLYLQRLEKLENIANSFDGVAKTFAVQAGRELRIIVEPTAVNDERALIMAREIAKEIESEVKYPGQIKVNVIRETRCIEYAQ
ncbi:ribonuclease Y [Verrucomicrobiota bacterium]